MKVSRLGYLALTMSKPEAWRQFGTAVLGLMDVSREAHADSVFLKMDEHPFRLLVLPGESDGFAFAGWEVESAEAMEQAAERLGIAGMTVERGDEAGASLRAVTDYISASDPAGNRFDVYYGRVMDGVAFESPVAIESFLTGDMGLGHAVFPAPNIDECHQFYVDVLGFGNSDDLRIAAAGPMPEQRVVFMHADNPRHHSLALYNLPVPSGIVHLMLEVGSLDEVGMALDRATKAGAPLLASLGRHVNDNMVSFYVYGPGGIAVEFGYDGLQLDWSTFEPTVSTEGDIWGHEYQVMGAEG